MGGGWIQLFLGMVASVSWALPIGYDISSLLSGSATLELKDGKRVTLKNPLLPGRQVVFEDLEPHANWGHAAKIKVLGPEGVLEEIEVQFPPKFFKMDLPVVSGSPLRLPSEVVFSVQDFDGKFRVPRPEKFYAVLINGQADPRHWNDFSFLFRVLLKVYGYQGENVFVADSTFLGTQSDLDGDGAADIRFPSTRGAILELFASLRARLKIDDQLLIVINDHGGRDGKESTIILSDGVMKASEFAPLVKALPTRRVFGIFEQCFSGGFVRPIQGMGRVAMAAATDVESSYASMDLRFDEFIYYVISAFAMQTHEGSTVVSDLNSDGRVSAQEAYSYAVARDLRPESPLLEASINSGESAYIGIGF